MKMRLFFLLMIIMCASLTFAQKQRKTVFIILDGIAADVVESMNLPNISRISKEGTFKRMNVGGTKGTYNETPTISAVGYNSFKEPENGLLVELPMTMPGLQQRSLII